jgi:hypothetical protein
MNFTFPEYADMQLTLGECLRNSQMACRQYQEKYTNRTIPSYKTFDAADWWICERGTVMPSFNERGVQCHLYARIEEAILTAVAEDPTVSTRRLGTRLRVLKDVVHSVWCEQQLHPFHFQAVQELHGPNPAARLQFCRCYWIVTTGTQRFLNIYW